MSIGNGAISAVEPGFFARLFPAEARYSGISLSRESGTIIGGGLFPLAATALLAGTHQSWPVAAIMVACSLLGLVSLGLARERGEDAKSANVVLARDAAAQD
jgi:MFS family permease